MEESSFAPNIVDNEKPPKDFHWLKVHLLQYGISLVICVGLFFLTLWIRDYWADTSKMGPGELKEWEVRKLCFIADGFTVPGFIFLCLGLLVFVSNQNFFKGTKYALIKVVAFIMPFSQKLQDKKYSDMPDVKKKSNYSFLFVIGVLLLIVSAIFIVVNRLY